MRKLTWLAIVLAAGLAPTAATLHAAPAEAGPSVEVTFALDTTGSMSGLIHAAKEKIWAIANTLATAKPTPDIKIGLVGYRDLGDEYVTKVVPMTDDLDAVYKELLSFAAAGGGDGPESVNQALHEAVTKMAWSKDESTYRVIFLVGDSPPHMDYPNDVKYMDSCKMAAETGITVNTIQCGTRTPTEPIWRDIARRADGRYFRVEQSGGAIIAETPFDAEIAELSREMDATRIYYGSASERQRQAEREAGAMEIYDKASVSSVAQRAAFNASESGKLNFLGGRELVADIESGAVKLGEVKPEELPEALRDLDAKEREARVKEQAARRADLQKRIVDLSEKRQVHIKTQMEKTIGEQKDSLDYQLFECIQAQGEKRGLEYKHGPAL